MFHGESTALTRPRGAYLAPVPIGAMIAKDRYGFGGGHSASVTIRPEGVICGTHSDSP